MAVKFSRLFPREWRQEFGDEFDAIMEAVPLNPRTVVDVLLQALKAQLNHAPMFLAWGLIAYLNLAAKEVQWPAACLLVFCFATACLRPRSWVFSTVFFFSAIPFSSFVQNLGRSAHPPINQTIVALIPALVGSLMGLGVAGSRTDSMVRS